MNGRIASALIRGAAILLVVVLALAVIGQLSRGGFRPAILGGPDASNQVHLP